MNQMTIKKATLEDAFWIFDELGEGAMEGRFASTVADDLQRMAIIYQVILRDELPIHKLRNGTRSKVTLAADLWVAQINSSPAGFLLSLYEKSRSRPVAVELHLGGVVSAFRKHGVFSNLVRHQISILPDDTIVYARCYPQSTSAISTLKKQGFVVTKMGNPIELAITSSSKPAETQETKGGATDVK